MCGRAALTASPDDLREVFGLDEAPELVPHYNLPPSSPLEVLRVVRGSQARKLEEMRWGLVPTWAKDPKIGHRLSLARVETVASTPAFRDAFRWRRCLVAVDGYYEWRRAAGKKGPSTPFFVHRPDRKPFALAGLWSRWTSPEGEVVESCAIVTEPARPPVEAIHDRMPLVLEHDAWAAWLDPAVTDPGALAPLLAPRDHDLVAYAVSTRVNDPRNDDPGCLTPAEPARPAQGSLF
jgi:putative SOS response-associated peptidase YedK